MASVADTGFGALKAVIVELSHETAATRYIDTLFCDLLICELNEELTYDQVTRAYRKALVAYLESFPEYKTSDSAKIINFPPDRTSRNMIQHFIAAKALDALSSVHPNTANDLVRTTFIMSFQPLFLVKDRMPGNMSDYLAHCYWTCLGRQVPPFGTAQLGLGDGRRCTCDEQDSDDDADDDGNSDIHDCHSDTDTNQGYKRDPRHHMNKHLSHLAPELTVPSVCEYCEKPDPELVCGDCAVKNDDVVAVATGYCNVDCQARHWAQHRKKCYEQRRLKTVVEVISKTVFAMESSACAVSLRSTRVGNDSLPVAELRFNPDEVLCGNPLLRPFPWKDFPSNRCAEQVFWHDIAESMPMIGIYMIRWILATNRDTISLIQEFRIEAKNVPLPFIIDADQYLIAPTGGHTRSIATSLSLHTVYRIVLRSGDDFCLDFCAPRFGWVETISRWVDFANSRV